MSLTIDSMDGMPDMQIAMGLTLLRKALNDDSVPFSKQALLKKLQQELNIDAQISISASARNLFKSKIKKTAKKVVASDAFNNIVLAELVTPNTTKGTPKWEYAEIVYDVLYNKDDREAKLAELLKDAVIT
jgi:hypothetical protein